MKRIQFSIICILVTLFSAQVNWQQVEPGVWKEIVGIPAADPNKYVLVIKL